MAQPARLQRVHFGFKASLLLGVASSAAVLLLGGCDTDMGKSDKTISAQLDDASAQMSGSSADQNSANSALGEAARDTSASPIVQLRAKALLGDSELQIAQGLVAKINANDVQIDRLTRELGLLTNDIEINNKKVAALAKYEPTALQNAVTQKKGDVSGSDAGADWYKSDAGAIASLAKVDSQAKDLQGKISALQDTIKSEMDQRNQLLDQADKLTQQSQHEEKQKSVDLYSQGSTARKQAADLTVKIDNDNSALAAQQADLGVLHGQHDALSAALKSLDDKSTTFDSDWKDVQGEQAGLNSDSKKILGEEPVNPPIYDKNGDLPTDATIGSKASAIDALAKANQDLRSQAETHFNNAEGKYGEAFTLATTIHNDLSDLDSKVGPESPDKVPWKQEQDALEPNTYRFLKADAELQKAEFFAQSAAEAKVRLALLNRIKPVIQEAKLTLFPTLDDSSGTIADQLKNAQSSARDAFKDSTELLSNIADGSGSPEQRNGAKLQEIFAQYAWYVLESSAGDAQAASNELTYAKNAVTAAVSDGATLPPLPPELAASAVAPVAH